MSIKLNLLLLICCFQISKAQILDTSKNKFIFKSLYNYAIQEDVKTILSILDTLPSERLTEDDLELKEKYYTRFTTGNEVFDHNTTEQFIKDVIDIYRNYWTSILLKQRSISEADTLLTMQLSEYLIKNYLKENNWNLAEVTSDPMKHFSMLLNKHGYFNNVDGKTGNLFDIYIWKTQDTINYDVQLPEENINVPVLFMKDIITLGWEEYATFGRAYPGGWPRDGVLFCVAKAYNTSEEKFLVGYLAHEAQHFSDLRKYAEISSWHLEYRAKLAELSKATETLMKRITNFIKGSKDDSTLSHPYAEYCVIRNMSNKIFGETFVMDEERWKSIDSEILKNAASELLKKDSSGLILKE